MEHLDFIVWMTLFPVAISLCRYLDNKACSGEKESSDSAQALSALIVICIWGSVGRLLY